VRFGHFVLLSQDLLQKLFLKERANGLRYRLVGGRRERHFDGIRSKLRKLPENAQTPTTMAPAYFAGDRVHAVLPAFDGLQSRRSSLYFSLSKVVFNRVLDLRKKPLMWHD